MLSECLGDSSMRLGVPFIAPRQLGAVEDQHGRLSLPSVEWRTRQSGAPADRWSSPRVVRRLRCRPLAQAKSGAPPDSPVHHRTVR
jgi:hypothetical protein